MNKNQVRITRIFSFEAAHALKDYNGACRNIHGHSYKLWVTVKGSVNPETGLLIDFKDLKKMVNEVLVDSYDHRLLLYQDDQMVKNNIGSIAQNLVVLPFNPSSENLIISFSSMIINALPDGVSLHHLKLYETEKSFTEWYSEDNL
jgi:6-pyruvoyltetrahydropterin/6-carboxytetrahydropterin synthase